MMNTNYLKGIAYYEEEDYINAEKHLIAAANEDCIEACLKLANMYFLGKSDLYTNEQAGKMNDFYCDKAIELGSIEAHVDKAIYIVENAESKEDFDLVYKHYMIAATHGNSFAQLQLSDWFYDDRAELSDIKRDEYLIKSLEQEDENAIYHVHEMFSNFWFGNISEGVLYHYIKLSFQGNKEAFELLEYTFREKHRDEDNICMRANKALDKLIHNNVIRWDSKDIVKYLTMFSYIDDQDNIVGFMFEEDAYIEIAKHFLQGELVQKDSDKAFNCLLKACESSSYPDDEYYTYTCFIENGWGEYLKQAINEGSKNAIIFLYMLKFQYPYIDDISEYDDLYKKLVDNHDEIAEYALGCYYLYEIKDKERAVIYLKLAANAGHSEAIKKLNEIDDIDFDEIKE